MSHCCSKPSKSKTLNHTPSITFCMSQIRQRSGKSNSSRMESNDDPVLREQGTGLSAKVLMDASPQQHGVVLKLHVPLLFKLVPDFLQRLLLAFSFLSFLCPSWKQRYLILCGSYLYKFKDQSSQTPKGSPFEVSSADAEIVAEDYPYVGSLPPGFDAIVSVSTLRRKHFYAVQDREEALLWVRSMRESKQEAITRGMGHAAHVPYPKSWGYLDNLAKSLVKSKDRIKERMELSGLREMEMSNLTEGGPIPRGYYG
eukprot:scaffold52_cov183-Cylindrotheca_fusiformis.AAC.17